MQYENINLGSDKMDRKKKPIILVLLALLALVALVACGSIPGEQTKVDSENAQGTNKNDPSVIKEEVKTNSFTIYYVDDQLLQIVEETHDIQYTSQDELLQKMWSAIKTPTNGQYIALWNDMNLLSLALTNDNLELNIEKPSINLGSSGEGFAIQTLINTFGQIEGVNTIQLLVEGNVVETLAGHVNIEKPFSKDDKIYTGQ
jgi:spore germination protein GerM